MFVVEERPAENAAMAARYQQREQEKTAAAQPAQTNVPVNDSAPPYQPTGANAFDPNAPVVQHKNFVKKIYDRLAINVAFRWILAMVALALSAVILSDGPAKQLKIAAAYTIAVVSYPLSTYLHQVSVLTGIARLQFISLLLASRSSSLDLPQMPPCPNGS